MTRIVIQYFDGCPSWRLAYDRVRTILDGRDDVSIDCQPVETHEDARRLQFAGSPTILIDGVDPFAKPGEPIGLSCRLYQTPTGLAGVPSMDQLIRGLTAVDTATADSPG